MEFPDGGKTTSTHIHPGMFAGNEPAGPVLMVNGGGGGGGVKMS